MPSKAPTAGLAALVLIGLAVCPAIDADADPACQRSAAAIGAWLKDLAAISRPSLPSYPQLTWVEQPGPAAWPEGLGGPLLELKLRRAMLNGEPLPDGLVQRSARLQAARHRYATLNQLRQGAGKAPGPAPVLLVAIDAAEPWTEVCALLQAASQAGFERLGLLYAHPDPDGPARPGPSSIDGRLADLGDTRSPSARTRLLAGILRAVLGRCPQLVATFEALAAQAPDQRAAALAAELPEALTGCRCKVDLPALRRLLWHMLYTPPLSVLVAPLAGPDEADPMTLRVPGTQRWQKVLPVLRKALAGAAPRPLVFEPGG